MAGSGTRLSSSESGIPTGLNRIKTVREPISLCQGSKRVDSVKPSVSSAPARKSKKKTAGFGYFRPGFSRGKKITWWLASYLSKDYNRGFSRTSATIKGTRSDGKEINTESPMRMELYTAGKESPPQQPASDDKSRKEVPRDLKASHTNSDKEMHFLLT